MTCSMCGNDADRDDLSADFSQTAVMALAATVARTGDAELAMCLDAVFRDQPEICEWIEQARHSRAARLVPA